MKNISEKTTVRVTFCLTSKETNDKSLTAIKDSLFYDLSQGLKGINNDGHIEITDISSVENDTKTSGNRTIIDTKIVIQYNTESKEQITHKHDFSAMLNDVMSSIVSSGSYKKYLPQYTSSYDVDFLID